MTIEHGKCSYAVRVATQELDKYHQNERDSSV